MTQRQIAAGAGDREHIGFIGAGHIGEPMVQRLLADGVPVTVFARKPQVRQRLSALGAHIADSIEALADNTIVIACLFDDAQLSQLAPSIIEGMSAGSVFASHTTGSPRTIRMLEQIGTPHQVAIVEAPFSGTPARVRTGELTVMLAGEAAAVRRVDRIISAYAAHIHNTGALGTASSTKLLNNVLFAACTQVTLSAIECARQLGIDEKVLLAVLADCSGDSTAARYIAASAEDCTAYAARISRYLSKDLVAARATAIDLDADISTLLAASRLGPMNLDKPIAEPHTSQ
ncbi:MAG: NAD(P)-dependent oxidoreductase [Gordonia sp. (in: high G+C Gram-positive bacteria)]